MYQLTSRTSSSTSSVVERKDENDQYASKWSKVTTSSMRNAVHANRGNMIKYREVRMYALRRFTFARPNAARIAGIVPSTVLYAIALHHVAVPMSHLILVPGYV